jgi:chaperonin GroES
VRSGRDRPPPAGRRGASGAGSLRYRAGVAPKQSSQATKVPKRAKAPGAGAARTAAVKPAPARTKEPVTVLFDRVLVQVTRADGERRSRAGILIPATAEVSRRLSWGEVVAVGPHVRAVKPSDKVLFNPEDRFEVEVQGEEYVILRERDIHAMASERIDGGTGLYL